MINILFIGDPHIKVDNIPEVEKFIEQSIIIAKEKKPDAIVIGGDLLDTHERLFTPALNKAYDLVNNMRLISKTYVLVGNHDYINNKQFLSQNHWMTAMKEWKNTVIVDEVILEYIKDLKFVFVPYVYTGSFNEALNTIGNKWKDARCIFAHQELYGCKMESKISVEGDRWLSNNPLIVSGHIHSKQKVQENIYYPGTPMQHNFGECDNDNTIAYISFDKTNYHIEEISLNLTKKKVISLNIDEVDEFSIDNNKDQLKLSVNGNYGQFKVFKKSKKYKTLTEKGVKIVFKSNNDSVIGKKIESSLYKECNNFEDILKNIIDQQKDPYLFQSYELIINGKNTNLEDIMFL
tara:strand:- start:6164 stop:7210 length:1047 start_codon:yes stop_codon:yes gene_type:complete